MIVRELTLTVRVADADRSPFRASLGGLGGPRLSGALAHQRAEIGVELIDALRLRVQADLDPLQGPNQLVDLAAEIFELQTTDAEACDYACCFLAASRATRICSACLCACAA